MKAITNVILLDRYRLETELGRGGTSAVYQGFDTVLERTMAVKVLLGSSLGTEGRARLLRDLMASFGSKLTDPIYRRYFIGCADHGLPAIGRAGSR